MKKLMTAVVAATALFVGVAPAQAEYPTAPVQFIVPWPPGDFEDILTRMIAKNMEEKTGVALIEPCLDEISILANIGAEPIGKLDGVETLASQAGINDIELWNGLFVKKGTPQEVIDVPSEVAKETMMGDEAQTLMKKTVLVFTGRMVRPQRRV